MATQVMGFGAKELWATNNTSMSKTFFMVKLCFKDKQTVILFSPTDSYQLFLTVLIPLLALSAIAIWLMDAGPDAFLITNLILSDLIYIGS
jgi:hypothetical protein